MNNPTIEELLKVCEAAIKKNELAKMIDGEFILAHFPRVAREFAETREQVAVLEREVEMAQVNAKESADNENRLWAIYKTCWGCVKCVPGYINGCSIQQVIDLSGVCNQYEAAKEVRNV